MLQYQNQKLAQQLEVQRIEIHGLEEKFAKLREKQARFDETLIAVNRAWNQLVEDMEVLASRTSAGVNGIKVQDLHGSHQGKSQSTVPVEETFLHRLIEPTVVKVEEAGSVDGSAVETALTARIVATKKILVHIVQAIELQRTRNEEIAAAVRDRIPETDAGRLLKNFDEDLRAEMAAIRASMDALHLRHRELFAENAGLKDRHARDQNELKTLRDQLEDIKAELESTRRKLIAMKQQKEEANVSPGPGSSPGPVRVEVGQNGIASKQAKEESAVAHAGLEDARKLAARRLVELETMQKVQLELTYQVKHLQMTLSDEEHVQASRPCQLLNTQVVALRCELERYRTMLEQVQRERDQGLLREKEMAYRVEAGDSARQACRISDSRAQELEAKLQQCMADRDSIQRRLEDAHSAAGRKETVAELKAMVGTLRQEMRVMEDTASKYKGIAEEVHALRADVQSLNTISDRKTSECEALTRKCTQQEQQSQLLREEVEQMQQVEQELKLFLEMFEADAADPRDMVEVKKAEARALAMVEKLKVELEEHSLSARVRQAKEAEAACQQRLVEVQEEGVQLRQQLDSAERLVTELRETLKSKNEEGEAYISEIETIGQAYEDMQNQNRRLLHTITERDDYNTQLMSESVKAKQLQVSLLVEKEAMASRVEHTHAASEVHKGRILRLEEQAKSYLEQLSKAGEDARQLQAMLDAAKRKQADAERDSQAAKASLEAVHRELEDRGRKLAEAAVELESERYKRRRLEEESETQGTKLARLGSYNGHASHDGRGPSVEELQDEIKEYKALLKCSVCHDRMKEVVITKCYHLFCSPCIQRNLEIRHRKCPGCGIPFGQNDVRNVYI